MELLNVYQDLVLGVGEKITVRDEDALNKGRLVEKYDSCTDEQLKTTMQSFIVPNGVVCVVLVTCAFGMGINCPNVYKAFKLGTSEQNCHVCTRDWSVWGRWPSGRSNPILSM